MTSESPQLFRLFQKVAPAWFFREVCQKHGCNFRDSIYSVGVVVWLMIWQRFKKDRSLSAAVQYLLQGGAKDLVSDCKRWTDDQVSAGTGSYSEARRKLPKLVAGEMMERMVDQLRAEYARGMGRTEEARVCSGRIESAIAPTHVVTGTGRRVLPPGVTNMGRIIGR